jgi:hypothetical protein
MTKRNVGLSERRKWSKEKPTVKGIEEKNGYRIQGGNQ